MPFQPRHAIVTASDPGIGRATAIDQAGAGMDIGVTWHSDEEGAQDTAVEVRAAGVKAEVTRLDTSELTGCGNVIDELADRLGGVDVFVNITGASWPVDGGMLQMGPQAGSHIAADDWRTG